MLVIAWEPQSYGLRVIEANLSAIIQKDCNTRQLEAITHEPLSQDLQEIALILGDTAASTTPLNTPYHSTVKILFHFYKCCDATPQQDGTYKTYVITAASFHPDLLPAQGDVSLPINHTWPGTMRALSQEAGCLPVASPWHCTPLHPGRVCSEPKLLQQLLLDFPIESFRFRDCESSDQFTHFTPDRYGRPSTTPAEYYLHEMTQILQHSKISNLEASKQIPYPLDQDRNYRRHYDNTFNRSFDNSFDERIYTPHGQSLDSHEVTRTIALHDISTTLAKQRLAEAPRNLPAAESAHQTPATKQNQHRKVTTNTNVKSRAM